MEKELNKKDIIFMLEAFLKKLEQKNIAKDSLEWYLKNNMETYLQSVIVAKSEEEVKKAVSIFRRFCLESMDWDTPLFKECSKFTK